MKKLFAVLLIALFLLGCTSAPSPKPTPTSTPSPSPSPVIKQCGGIAGFPCPQGYSCEYTETYPDAMGTCVKASPTPNSNDEEYPLEGIDESINEIAELNETS